MPTPAASVASLPHGATAGSADTRSPQAIGFSLGKYREILIAVAFFLIFDLAVLVLNFYVSYQISEDAISINMAGRQRMLTQRLAKSLFSAELTAQSGFSTPQPVLDEVRLSSRLFDESLQALRHGGMVSGGDGTPVRLQAASSENSAALLKRSVELWEPWYALLKPLHQPSRSIANASAQEAALLSAGAYARQNNLALLGLMNELTSDLEASASERASLLRKVQTAGIVLALLNFIFILFKFIRRLRQSDDAIEQAQDETREILSVVREGLFLLTPQFTLGTQVSQSVGHILGRPVHAGDSFLGLLSPLVTPRVFEDARSYVELLFAPHIQENLVQSINPLSHVSLALKNPLGYTEIRHLSLRFNRVMQDGLVRHLLVTVQDVSERVALEDRLQGEQKRAQREFDLLMQATEASPLALAGFIHRSESALLEVNDLLRQVESLRDAKSLRRTVDAIYRHVHAVKGEAAMLSLELLSVTAHEFETLLQGLREADHINGEALLALPLPLEDMLNRLKSLKRLVPRHRPPTLSGAAAASTVSNENLARLLQDLARRVATDLHRSVQLHATLEVPPDALPDATRDAFHRIAVQLVRNAVSHGIESETTRQTLGKPPAGQVRVSLRRRGESESGSDGEPDIELTVSDDGPGLDTQAIRARLLTLRWATPEQLDEMSPSQLAASIFKPGFSTASTVGEHAGRGVGLDVVAAEVRRLGARLLIASQPGQGTQFHIRWTP